uniref:Uncharacterized protein n=1 Tax=Chromera velia CCMP2878 TaxID=1169474 RepID=A0A0G4F5J3_9ALVE|eukprot:Cvel_15168.t1-p1 / transcript=Cvel_15168.t1 / gene=Cvel_15168 / organism=Chromera_velia_CCMP2878 / gene_product=hypothetical protein / transcript_product=hypothetical protein / location=Cvel_scaffold1108:29027-30353(+) / protein_length=310 / sequence_SO=supercontig / SO=protein_coding / is_pseudo=false
MEQTGGVDSDPPLEAVWLRGGVQEIDRRFVSSLRTYEKVDNARSPPRPLKPVAMRPLGTRDPGRAGLSPSPEGEGGAVAVCAICGTRSPSPSRPSSPSPGSGGGEGRQAKAGSPLASRLNALQGAHLLSGASRLEARELERQQAQQKAVEGGGSDQASDTTAVHLEDKQAPTGVRGVSQVPEDVLDFGVVGETSLAVLPQEGLSGGVNIDRGLEAMQMQALNLPGPGLAEQLVARSVQRIYGIIDELVAEELEHFRSQKQALLEGRLPHWALQDGRAPRGSSPPPAFLRSPQAGLKKNERGGNVRRGVRT